jgi:crotonobetainyl-CoA:carnitine CoA-transferase CaiB-like acyl-CoA transferase
MRRPLAGIGVVEVGASRAIGYAGRLLADLGAEVTRVEAGARREEDPPDALELVLAAGKRCVAMDALEELLASCRIVLIGSLQDATPDVLDAERIAAERPRLVVVSVSAYGLRGPASRWAADDLSLQAQGGISIGIGLPGQPPLKLPGEQTTFQSGVCAAIAALGTLFSGRGALIDLSALDVWASFYSGVEVALAHFGRHRKQRAGHRVSGQPYPRTLLRCKDGYFAIQCGESRHWQGFLEMIAREDLLAHPLFRNRFKANDLHGDACDDLIEPWFLARTREEILQACLEHRIPGAPVYALGDLLAHPHLRGRDYFTAIDTPRGRLELAGDPYASLTRRAGAAERDRETGAAAATRRATPDASPDKRRPLAGLRVVDFGWVWAGAVPGHILADLGAEVIKLESASPLDYMRQGRPIVGTEKDPEQNPMFQNVNRGKLSFRIKLDHPGARALVADLVATSDVVIENFSPGVMEKFGLDYAALQRVRPDLVMCSMSAVGQTGPLRGIRTYATMIASLAGLDGLVGYPGERVLGSQSSYADPNASLHATLAILAALWRRRQTGQGAHIDFSQWEAAVSVMAGQIAEHALTGKVPQPCGTWHASKAPHGHYPAAGDDNWVAISVAGDAQWRTLAAALDNPPWMALDAYATQARRLAHRAELDRQLAEETRRHEATVLANALAAAGVPAAPLNDSGVLAANAQLRARALFEMVEHPVLGMLPVYRLPWHIDHEAIPITRRAPLIGEHNRYVLHEVLGYPGDRVSALADQGLFS